MAFRKRTVYRLFPDTDEIGVWGNFEDKDHFKSLPGSYWDKDDRCWRVPKRFLADVEELLVRLNGASNSSAQTPLPTQISAILSSIFAAVPADQAERTYKSLVRAWHPDVGGNNQLMADLNAAWDRHNGKK